MKVLTMCQGGNSRSVACAYILKYEYGMDALACSWECNVPDTLKMLFEWADGILLLEGYMISHVPEDYKAKTFIVDVGPDRWSDTIHPCGGGVNQADLLAKLRPMLQAMIKVEEKAVDV